MLVFWGVIRLRFAQPSFSQEDIKSNSLRELECLMNLPTCIDASYQMELYITPFK